MYLSNEAGEHVYFDNFKVTHNRGRILEENHYYAYGLKIQAISSRKLGEAAEGHLDNKYQFQGAFSEMDEDIGWNQFALRDYDPQLGRFVQQDPYQQYSSPYTGMGNDPVNNIDPSGGVSWPPGLGQALNFAKEGGTLAEVVITFTQVTNSVSAPLRVINVVSTTLSLLNSAVQGCILVSGNVATSGIGHTAGPQWGSHSLFAPVHQQANANGIYRNGVLSVIDNFDLLKKYVRRIRAMNAGTVYADSKQFQDGASSPRHGMRDEYDTPEEAKKKADRFVREQFRKAREALKHGKEYEAYFEFGVGLHALQDATSPAHAGFQKWTGKETLKEQIEHVKKELTYPGKSSNLQKITNKYLEWFESGKELPEGNLFDGILSDR